MRLAPRIRSPESRGILTSQSSASYLVPVEDLWSSVDDAKVHYLRSGSGPNLVLVHGLLGYSFSWRFIIPDLAQNSTVYAPDMPGSGFSEHPRHIKYYLRGNAERLLRFLDAVGVDRCDLLGTSYGGAVAMAAAACASDRIRSLILAAPVNPWSAGGSYKAALLAGWPVAASLKLLGPYVRFFDRFILARLYGDREKIRPGTLEGYSAPFRVRGALEGPLQILRSWNSDLKELQSILPQIAAIPTLLIWGDKDAAVDPASIKPLQTQLINCQTTILKGVGHLAYEEVPEEFAGIVSSFLSDLPSR
ncbi:MAG: alpha/beta hydrolase [Acidobacteriaceae bacterium]